LIFTTTAGGVFVKKSKLKPENEFDCVSLDSPKVGQWFEIHGTVYLTKDGKALGSADGSIAEKCKRCSASTDTVTQYGLYDSGQCMDLPRCGLFDARESVYFVRIDRP
jgi:hypothetical protein